MSDEDPLSGEAEMRVCMYSTSTVAAPPTAPGQCMGTYIQYDAHTGL
jgi:hypothetical protein